MQAFKLYFKIFKKNSLISTILYVVIFSALCLLFVQIGTNNPDNAFSIDKRRVAVINNDNSQFSNELENYIKQNTKVVKIDTSEKGIKDALFFRNAEYIITIPEGYGDAFLAKKPIGLETRTIPDSMSGTFIDMMVNKYLRAFDMYLNATENMPFDEIVSNVNKDLAVSAEVKLQDKSSFSTNKINYYFSYASYPIFCIMILSVGLVLNSINQKDIKRRNLCAPINSTKFSLQIFFGNIVLDVAVFIIFTLYAFMMYPKAMLTLNGLFYTINLFLISLVALALSFLIGNIASKKAIQPICNTVSLAFAFLGGAFVPQDILSNSVKKFAIFDPVFWFVKSNDQISLISSFDWNNLKPIVFSYGIQFAFSLAFLSVTLVIIKQKRTKD